MARRWQHSVCPLRDVDRIARDLKPANVTVDKDRNVKVLGFRLAKLKPDTTGIAGSELRK